MVKTPVTKTPRGSHRPPSPTGWSWLCPCGWSTPRDISQAAVERSVQGHQRLHAAAIDLKNLGHLA